jgi:hypothetical protein
LILKKVFPFGSGSLYTSSFAISASHAIDALAVESAITASAVPVGAVLFPVSGSGSVKKVCVITFEQYQQVFSGSAVENCVSGVLSGSRLSTC